MSRSEGRGVRLQKVLSRAGVASRREAERWIEAGRVRVNGVVVTVQGTRVDPDRDRIEVDGRPIRSRPAPRWVVLHKPRGTVTTRSDPRGRRTVYELLDPGDRGLSYVGRLDRDTEGLLLFTNEGHVAHRLLHPSSEIPRTYEAWVSGVPDERTLGRLEEGVELEDGPARAESVRLLRTKSDRALISLVLREGRKREVRRMLSAVGYRVRQLRRVRFGPLALGRLRRGAWRELEPAEVEALRAMAERPGE